MGSGCTFEGVFRCDAVENSILAVAALKISAIFLADRWRLSLALVKKNLGKGKTGQMSDPLSIPFYQWAYLLP